MEGLCPGTHLFLRISYKIPGTELVLSTTVSYSTGSQLLSQDHQAKTGTAACLSHSHAFYLSFTQLPHQLGLAGLGPRVSTKACPHPLFNL